jgi:hypothetical protein
MSILAIIVNRTETIQAYQNVHRHLRDSGNLPPAGLAFQVAAAADPGYQVITVWDSLASFARFRDELLRPALQAEGIPPENLTTTTFEVTSCMAGDLAAAQQPAPANS